MLDDDDDDATLDVSFFNFFYTPGTRACVCIYAYKVLGMNNS